MSDKPVNTVAGPFDRERLGQLKTTLEAAETDTTMFEGQALDCAFGKYLVEYVETQFAMKGHDSL